MIVRARGVDKKQLWLLPSGLLHITRTDENQILPVLILITYLKDVSGCVFLEWVRMAGGCGDVGSCGGRRTAKA